MNKKVLAGIAGAAVLVYVGIGFLAPQPSDDELIQTALDEAIQASKEGRPGSVIDLLANDFAVNGERFSTGQIAERIRKMKPNIKFADRTPTISGESANLKSSVALSLAIGPSMNIDNVEVIFEKRPATRMLFFPTKKWEVTDVNVPEEAFEQFGSAGF